MALCFQYPDYAIANNGGAQMANVHFFCQVKAGNRRPLPVVVRWVESLRSMRATKCGDRVRLIKPDQQHPLPQRCHKSAIALQTVDDFGGNCGFKPARFAQPLPALVVAEPGGWRLTMAGPCKSIQQRPTQCAATTALLCALTEY